MIYLILLSMFSVISTYWTESGVVDDYYEGLAIAKEKDKPIFLFFTGNECENILPLNKLLSEDDDIRRSIESQYVSVYLYVDDRTPLATPEVVYRNGKLINLRTKGNLWGHIEISKYSSRSQPYIVFIDADENIIKPAYAGPWTKDGILNYLSAQ